MGVRLQPWAMAIHRCLLYTGRIETLTDSVDKIYGAPYGIRSHERGVRKMGGSGKATYGL